MEESIIVIINTERAKYYFDLMEKYHGYSHTNKEENEKFFDILKELINEEESVFEFEVKIALLESLIIGINTKKFDTISH